MNGEMPSAVRYELTPVDGGTELTLIHTHLPDEMCGGYAPGWHAYLVRLRAEGDIEAWTNTPLTEGETALAEINDWGPTEDWTDWAHATR